LSDVPHQDFLRKIFFRQKYANDISIEADFDVDYGFAIIFGENIYMKNEKRKARVHFGM
jgi:hypothetical protein